MSGTQRRDRHQPSAPVGSSQAEIELKIAQQRQNMLNRLEESEERVRARRAYREQTLAEREREIEESLRRSERERAERKATQEQEERLAAELERYKAEQLRDVKMRQQLRETR